MNASITLDQLPPRARARIVLVHWDALAPEEGKRLRTLGIEEGAEITVAHRGIFAGRDPLALVIGRMTIALRRAHARAMVVELVSESDIIPRAIRAAPLKTVSEAGVAAAEPAAVAAEPALPNVATGWSRRA